MTIEKCVLAVSVCAACAMPDRTITRGADGSADWDRHLASAIPLGISADSARAIMLGNGFRCQDGVDSVAYIWCDKESAKPIVKRRWHAIINLNASRSVFAVRGSTGLVGP